MGICLFSSLSQSTPWKNGRPFISTIPAPERSRQYSLMTRSQYQRCSTCLSLCSQACSTAEPGGSSPAATSPAATQFRGQHYSDWLFLSGSIRKICADKEAHQTGRGGRESLIDGGRLGHHVAQGVVVSGAMERVPERNGKERSQIESSKACHLSPGGYHLVHEKAQTPPVHAIVMT